MVFRISEIADKVLPHDALTLGLVDADSGLVRQATSRADFPDLGTVRSATTLPDEIAT